MLSIGRKSNHLPDHVPSYVICRKGFQLSAKSLSILCYPEEGYLTICWTRFPPIYGKDFQPPPLTNFLLCYLQEGFPSIQWIMFCHMFSIRRVSICWTMFHPMLLIERVSYHLHFLNHLYDHVPSYVIYRKVFYQCADQALSYVTYRNAL